MRRFIIPEYIYAVEYDTKTGESRQVFPPITEEQQIKRRQELKELREWYENRPKLPIAPEPPKKIEPLNCKRCNAT